MDKRFQTFDQGFPIRWRLDRRVLFNLGAGISPTKRGVSGRVNTGQPGIQGRFILQKEGKYGVDRSGPLELDPGSLAAQGHCTFDG
jgi:hypothetical protein